MWKRRKVAWEWSPWILKNPKILPKTTSIMYVDSSAARSTPLVVRHHNADRIQLRWSSSWRIVQLFFSISRSLWKVFASSRTNTLLFPPAWSLYDSQILIWPAMYYHTLLSEWNHCGYFIVSFYHLFELWVFVSMLHGHYWKEPAPQSRLWSGEWPLCLFELYFHQWMSLLVYCSQCHDRRE